MPTKKSQRKSPKRRASKPAKRFTPPNVGPAFQKLVAVMSRLRAPGGCPWDREQTHATLRTYLIEEAYEVLDALDSTDDAKFAEELGDLLLQVLFHAQIAHEERRFDISDVVREIYEKMIRRHPHVFGTTRANTAAEVLRNWEQIKLQERAKSSGGRNFSSDNKRVPTNGPSRPEDPQSVLDGVPRTLPALLEALQLTRKAARIGFDWHNLDGIFAKLTEETQELQAALATATTNSSPVAQGEPARRSGSEGGSASPAALSSATYASPATVSSALGNSERSKESSSSPPRKSVRHSAKREGETTIESELGDILFVAVNLARFLNIDPELALKKTSTKFSRRFRAMEQFAREQGTTLAQIPRPQMESLWDQAKLQEHSFPNNLRNKTNLSS